MSSSNQNDNMGPRNPRLNPLNFGSHSPLFWPSLVNPRAPMIDLSLNLGLPMEPSQANVLVPRYGFFPANGATNVPNWLHSNYSPRGFAFTATVSLAPPPRAAFPLPPPRANPFIGIEGGRNSLMGFDHPGLSFSMGPWASVAPRNSLPPPRGTLLDLFRVDGRESSTQGRMKRRCHVCGRVLGSGKALGGHMSSHEKERKKKLALARASSVEYYGFDFVAANKIAE